MNYHAYIPVVNRFDLLENAVASAKAYHGYLTVVDNSPDGSCPTFPGSRVFHPCVPLSFTQSQNYFFKDARINRNAEFIIWMHNDAVPSEGACEELLGLANEYTKAGRKWGVLYTHYDVLSAVNLEMIDDIGGYDTNILNYHSDNDLYYRARLRKWELINTDIKVDHVGSQTINSDPDLQFINSVTFRLSRQYYVEKWAGEPGKEMFTVPFGRSIFS